MCNGKKLQNNIGHKYFLFFSLFFYIISLRKFLKLSTSRKQVSAVTKGLLNTTSGNKLITQGFSEISIAHLNENLKEMTLLET